MIEMEDIFYYLSAYLELASFAIMIYGALLALFHFLKYEIRRLKGRFVIADLDIVRHDFAYYILLGMEFLIAADIIQTILKPTEQELIELGGIVLIRVILSYFLNKEMKDIRNSLTGEK